MRGCLYGRQTKSPRCQSMPEPNGGAKLRSGVEASNPNGFTGHRQWGYPGNDQGDHQGRGGSAITTQSEGATQESVHDPEWLDPARQPQTIKLPLSTAKLNDLPSPHPAKEQIQPQHRVHVTERRSCETGRCLQVERVVDKFPLPLCCPFSLWSPFGSGVLGYSEGRDMCLPLP